MLRNYGSDTRLISLATSTNLLMSKESSRQKWISEAFALIAERGISALSVEALAKRMDLTKGSFYWHFSKREALLSELRDIWKQTRLCDIQDQIEAAISTDGDAISQLIDVYACPKNAKGLAIELAVRDWARHDPRTAAAVDAVDYERLRRVFGLLTADGVSEVDAKINAMMIYAYIFGHSLLQIHGKSAEHEQVKEWIKSLNPSVPNANSHN